MALATEVQALQQLVEQLRAEGAVIAPRVADWLRDHSPGNGAPDLLAWSALCQQQAEAVAAAVASGTATATQVAELVQTLEQGIGSLRGPDAAADAD
ncbi:MAG: hypothetical protein JNK49_10550, partial [Planctomycetes bacterium]|nr:hypothetical protein [Planctomycetota bacterium]